MKLTFLISAASLLVISFYSLEQTKNNSAHDSVTTKTIKNKFETTEIDCDSVYRSKGYKITLKTFDTTIFAYDTTANSIFELSKESNGHRSILFSDSIHNMIQEVRFADFNGDNVKDILVQNISDVRSNWTYYLYLVDTIHDKLKKIKGFEEIKNPNYVAKYNIIDNYVLSGKNWTSFYKIQSDTIKEFDIVMYDDQTNINNYNRAYQKAIKKILATGKNNR